MTFHRPPSSPDALHQAAVDLHIATYRFVQEARKGGVPIAREDLMAVLHITNEWADLCSEPVPR